MIGVNLKIKKNKIIKKNFYNNNSKVLIFKYPKNEIFVIGDIFEYFFLIIQKLKKKNYLY